MSFRVIDGRERFALLPNGHRTHCFWLYVLGLSRGRVKFGITAYPMARFASHWRAFDGRIAWAHVSRRFQTRIDALRAERAVLAAADQIGQREAETEIFAGISKAQAMQCVRVDQLAAPVCITANVRVLPIGGNGHDKNLSGTPDATEPEPPKWRT